ncbi:hypothetical protein BDV26DRAFT_230719 [Aspergillus bertholletiae]|uniref:Uncharacterized protein n=1 Tax=Aspergillus bertholletiae TaxID=1226010 RepID=A0A5N7B3Q9_9EURO|nr:hypothetical protein BDV26DRAFT_230719 [Aspergillus bertholletiae]
MVTALLVIYNILSLVPSGSVLERRTFRLPHRLHVDGLSFASAALFIKRLWKYMLPTGYWNYLLDYSRPCLPPSLSILPCTDSVSWINLKIGALHIPPVSIQLVFWLRDAAVSSLFSST